MGKSSSPPAAPDYTAAATAQGAANLDAARATAKLSNPNINSPYGSQSVTYGTPKFDQSAYDKAVAQYSAGTQASSGGPEYITQYTTTPDGVVEPQNVRNPNYVASTNPSGSAPTREQFTTYENQDTPTVTQTLNPQSQQIFDAQQGTRQGLAELSGDALKRAQGIMSQPFSYNGPPIQTSLTPSGDIRNTVGDAGAISRGPSAGDYGYASGMLDLSNVAKLPINAGQTGQAAIMARLQPQIEQSNNAYAAQLANQGIVQGSEAYDNAMRVHNQKNNDLLSQAALQGLGLDFTANNQGFNQALQSGQFGNQAIAQNFGQGLASSQNQNAAQQQQYGQNLNNAQFYNQAQNQGFNQNLQSGQFANTAQQQALEQALYQRNLPLNEISALMSGSQIQNPQFQGYQGTQVQPAPLFNATTNQYNSGLQGYGMQNNSNNAFMSGLFGLGGAALGGPIGAKAGGFMSGLLGG